MPLVWCAAGLALLVLGAELVVRGGTHVAARLGVPPLVIGLTIVAVGTSTPELAVGIDAALRGEGELAVGNIAGTNIVNILLILGLSALIEPLAIRMQTIRLDLPIMILASLMLVALAWDGNLSRIDGIILTMSALAYTMAILHIARRESQGIKAAFSREFAARPDSTPTPENLLSLGALAAGLVVIAVGADLLVDGAVALARQWGVSDAFIGLTIVAIGTSSPELVTTVVSTIRKARDIAIGNLLGSSIYNILFILGITCIVPDAGIQVGQALIRIDIPLTAAVALLCIPVFVSGRSVTRFEGGLFVIAYAVYLAYLIAART
ncbi:MAG: calcium/sodium antiporter [Novosphingobium sp.]